MIQIALIAHILFCSGIVIYFVVVSFCFYSVRHMIQYNASPLYTWTIMKLKRLVQTLTHHTFYEIMIYLKNTCMYSVYSSCHLAVYVLQCQDTISIFRSQQIAFSSFFCQQRPNQLLRVYNFSSYDNGLQVRLTMRPIILNLQAYAKRIVFTCVQKDVAMAL